MLSIEPEVDLISLLLPESFPGLVGFVLTDL
jgi:hypothetical protein